MKNEKRSKSQIVISTILVVIKSLIYSFVAIICSSIAHDSELFYCTNIFDFILTPFILWEYLAIIILPVFIFAIVELITAKKLKTSLFESFIPLLITLAVSVIYYVVSDFFASGTIVVTLLMLAGRLLIAIIDLITRKRQKFIPVCIIFAIVSVLMYSLLLMYQDEIKQTLAGVPDKTGSWSSINQEVKRDSDWKEIVAETDFKIDITEELVSQEDYNRDNYVCYAGTYPIIDGSTVCVPLAVEFARQHLDMDDETANSFVNFHTTPYAYLNLIKNTSDHFFYYNDKIYDIIPSGEGTDIILATQPSEDEIVLADRFGVTFVKKPICHDAFVFITHKDNPVDSLTVEQIRKIYTGQLTNWSEVGGNNKKIRAYQREENSGSQTAMEELVMKGSAMSDPIRVPIIAGMGALINAVAEYENNTSSIGYTYKYYIETLYKNDNIKTLAVDGITPSDENIKNGTYPFSTSYYGVIRAGDEEKTGGKFLDWILSEEGQKCVEQAGYIPVR